MDGRWVERGGSTAVWVVGLGLGQGMLVRCEFAATSMHTWAAGLTFITLCERCPIVPALLAAGLP